MFMRLRSIRMLYIIGAVILCCQGLGAIQPEWIHDMDTMLASITFADLDGDSVGEIIAVDFTGSVCVWDMQGNNLPGWPVSFSETTPATPVIGDIDGDGDMELVIGSWYHLYVYNHDGTLYPGWPCALGAFYSPSLEDLDGDGDMEIIYPQKNSVLYVIQHDCTILPGFPVTTPDPYIGTCSVADIDGDNSFEIVSGMNCAIPDTVPSKVYVWNSDGSVMSGFPVSTCGTVGTPAIGDLDGDGTLEIIAGAYNNGEHDSVYVWDNQGNLKPGWPKEAHACLRSTPALGDLDRDGDLEILIGGMDWYAPTWDSRVYAWHHDGTPVQNWPVTVGSGGNINSSPIIAEIDGDTSQIEILFKAADTIYAYHADGTNVNGFPYFLYDQSTSGTKSPSPAVGDLDSDGDLEMAFASVAGEIHFFDEPEQYFSEFTFWPMFKHDCRNTGYYHSENAGIESPNEAEVFSRVEFSCRPNPFKEMTEIRYQVPDIQMQDVRSKKQDISLKIYDVSGRIVKVFNLTSGFLPLASTVSWNGVDNTGQQLSSGVYFCRLRLGNNYSTIKILLLQ